MRPVELLVMLSIDGANSRRLKLGRTARQVREPRSSDGEEGGTSRSDHQNGSHTAAEYLRLGSPVILRIPLP